MKNFINIGISSTLATKLQSNGFIEPTPIQKEAIPPLLEGKDIIAQSQTGSGKTLAFLLPILDKVNPDESFVQSVIVTPTRELAIQISTELKKIKPENINTLAVYGGQDVERQIKKLSGGVHVVVATPGRLIDHLNRGTIELNRVSMLVLDEADQMLHIGFLPDVERIIEELPSTRQTFLFSATLSDQVQRLAKNYLNRPVHIKIEAEQITVKEIKQYVYETTDRAKQNSLKYILQQHRPYLAIIFCRTKRRVSTLTEALKSSGFNCEELHGDLSQSKREQVMRRFREADLQYLVATNVAARGLDVEGVTHVFNYDIPLDAESYIHRIGRTGRAGGKGLAITFVAPKDESYLKLIEKGIEMKLEKREIETEVLLQHKDDDKKHSEQKRSNNTKKRTSFEKPTRNSSRSSRNNDSSKSTRRGRR